MNERIKELINQMDQAEIPTEGGAYTLYESDLEYFANLIAAHERELIKKAVEELNPVENNPLLQNKPASFWIQNFKQIVSERGTT